MSTDVCTDHEHFTKPQSAMLKAILFYQVAREGRPSPCRFYPSCSHYAVEAIETHGSVRGLWLTIRRLIRCRHSGHPESTKYLPREGLPRKAQYVSSRRMAHRHHLRVGA